MSAAGAILTILALAGGYDGELTGPVEGGHPTAGLVDGLRVDPERSTVVAVRGDRVWRRQKPGEWIEAGTVAELSGWTSATERSSFRSPTGEPVLFATRLSGGVTVGVVRRGLVESNDGFRTVSEPVGLPAPGLRAAASESGGTVLACADPSGLFRCSESGCVWLQDVACTAVTAFEDGTILAGDDTGGVWRWDGHAWARRRLGSAAITEINGVPDGGPRHAIAEDGGSWVSQDHGKSWTTGDAAPGRLGSGGMLARIRDDGALETVELDGSRQRLTEPGSLPVGAPIRWASAEVIVIGLKDSVVVANRRSGAVRRLAYPTPPPNPFFDARVHDDKLVIHSGAGGLLRFETVAAAPWTVDRFVTSARESVWWILALVGVLAAVFWWLQRRMTRL